MKKFTLLTLVALLVVHTIAGKKKCQESHVKKFTKCLAKGFETSIASCRSSDTSLQNKKTIKKCTKIQKKMTKCGYSCAAPVDGGWSNFGDWSTCSETCGGGSQTRTRSCNNPSPTDSGAQCVGENSESQPCNTGGCPGKCDQNSCTKGEINYVALKIGSKLMSSNGDYTLIMQTDGNLVIYCRGNPTWGSGTTGKTIRGGLYFQSDCNLVLYDPSGAVWQSGTQGDGATKMIMQDDGNFVLYNNGNPVWATGTTGKC